MSVYPKQKEWKKQHRLDFFKQVNEYKASQPCTDCGNFYPPICMDFDHLRDKHINVSRMYNYSFARVLEEIAKCELVCSNCHRIRTRDRLLA